MKEKKRKKNKKPLHECCKSVGDREKPLQRGLRISCKITKKEKKKEKRENRKSKN